jgi:hypothetical protein
MKTIPLAIITSVALLGCASRIDVDSDQKSLSNAKSCCTSIATLPSALPAAPAHEVRLSPESAHFDFGEGLAPFVITAVDPGKARLIEVVSTLHTTTLEAGNMYHFRGVVPTVIFLGVNGERLPAPAPSPTAPVLAGTSGQYSLSTQIVVPAAARKMVVASRMKAVGARNGGCIHPGGSGRPVALDQCIVYPAGVLKVEDWRGAIYGQVKLMALP